MAERHAPGDQAARHGQREPRQGDEHDGAGQQPQRPLVAGAARRSIAWPVSHGMATVATMASAASASDQAAPAR